MVPFILVVDNHDSFTYNLVQLLRGQGATVQVGMSDALSVAEIEAHAPDGIVISPGPGFPRDAGVSIAVIQQCQRPLLGVCLGHQSIAEAFGGLIIRAPHPVHGRASAITHDRRGLFSELPQELLVGRYHSLCVDATHLPSSLEVTAVTHDGVIMGLRHRERPIEGVQFHPESVLTPMGSVLIARFLQLCAQRSHTTRDVQS